MFFVILVDDVYCVAIHDLSPVLTALFSIELGGFNTCIVNILHILQKYIKKDFHMVMSYTCGTI